MNKDMNIEEILKRIGTEDVPADVHKIAEEASESFSKTLMPPKQHILWSDIMKSRITKLAAAATIIVAAAVLIHYVGSPIESVALADVLERVEQAQAFIYRMKMTMTGAMTGAMMEGMPAGKKQMQGAITISNEYGMKMEMTMADADTDREEMNQLMYVLPDQKVMIMVMPQQKKYTRMEFDDDMLARMKKSNNDPREMIKQIMSCEYTELGRSVIDGIEVEGFQTTDPSWAGGAGAMESVKVSLWVDAQTWLPVRAEMDLKMNEQMQMSGVIYDYQWDIPVDASQFEPVIPEDFTVFPADGMKMPPMTEEAAIEGLRFFAELYAIQTTSNGRYPKNLNMMNLMQEFGNLMQEFGKLKDSQSPASEQIREQMQQKLNIKEDLSEEETATKVLDMMRPSQSLAMFYMTLVQDKKDPAYYGESVGPGDADAVLLRWKVSEGQYRVIFGDLTVEDVSAERLAELENPPSQ